MVGGELLEYTVKKGHIVSKNVNTDTLFFGGF